MTRVERAMDFCVIVAALATIPLIIAQERGAGDDPIVVLGDWLVWLVFLAQYLLTLAIARHRRVAVRPQWYQLMVVVLTYPQFPALLGVLRLTRLASLLRLFRMASVLWRGSRSLRLVLGRPGLVHVAAVSAALLFAGGSVMSVWEPETVRGDLWAGVWWATVTATTVGYGDISPVTPLGRLLAVALMLSGIGLTSTLAASVAAHFVGHDQSAETKALAERLDRIEALLCKQRGSDELHADASAGGASGEAV